MTNTNKTPCTFIRLDTAHFIHSISTWKCFKTALNKIVSTFFIHCMALMIECKTLNQLEEIFIRTLIVSNTEFEDSIISVSNDCVLTPVEARNRLELLISDRKPDITATDTVEIDLEKSIMLDQLSHKNLDSNGWSEGLLTWIKNLCGKANALIVTGPKLNSFYVRDLYDQLVRTIKEFPIWTNICMD